MLFQAEWCAFCRRFYPEFAAALNGKRIPWAEVDISKDEDPLWETFDISVVPTVIVFKDGQPIFRRDGLLGRGLSEKAIEEIVQEIEKHAIR